MRAMIIDCDDIGMPERVARFFISITSSGSRPEMRGLFIFRTRSRSR
jgi:hypothetical protein